MEIISGVEIYENVSEVIDNYYGEFRFIVLAESETNSRAFLYSVIDTDKIDKSHPSSIGENICETFNKNKAVIICLALADRYGKFKKKL